MMQNTFYNTEYYLKHKDEKILQFNPYEKTVAIINNALLPLCIRRMKVSFDMIRVFCSNRVLMLSRRYCKDILLSCGIEDQTDVTICLMCLGLSFTDNYWITPKTSIKTWKDVNLRDNKFSLRIAKVALTGVLDDIGKFEQLGDDLYTGELTVKGTRAKCFYRSGNDILLVKNETLGEINAEVFSYYIATLLGLQSSRYIYKKMFGVDCSVCRIETSDNRELLLCSDLMTYYNEHSTQYNSCTYAHFMKVDSINFILMQIFDYITLNSDRNRDNYGLLLSDGREISLYPLFDHDSCFKGRAERMTYFVTGLSFEETLRIIKVNHSDIFKKYVLKGVYNLKANLSRELCLRYISEDNYTAMLKRINNVLK